MGVVVVKNMSSELINSLCHLVSAFTSFPFSTSKGGSTFLYPLYSCSMFSLLLFLSNICSYFTLLFNPFLIFFSHILKISSPTIAACFPLSQKEYLFSFSF